MTSQETKKPLSEKPLGYFLAILGGTFGAPLGWITSPVILLILNNVMKGKDGKEPNRFLVWGLIGIIGAPLSLAPIIGSMNRTASSVPNTQNNTVLSTPQPQDTSGSNLQNNMASSTSQSQNTSGVNMENYTKLQTGMTYEEVISILGRQGEEMSSNDIGGYKNIMYKWDGDTGFGANMNAMFQNGKLIQKSQFGLK